ncbi:hypothetical protein FRB94_009541 [Tulasnella sp. JGI-2019a]|nr:hypothetical protein FRB94_009541 [Tulasnella sp. JGI-2019a]
MMRSFDIALKTFGDGLQRHRSAKARHHNTLLPISRLPNDLLIEIFALASKTEDRLKGPSYGGRMGVRMLATFVFVCHEWREAVYNAPSLWAYIRSDHSYRATLECLARSGQVPLHISLSSHDAIHWGSRARILQEVHRWKSVKLYSMATELLRELEQRPAPLLEKLDVQGNWEYPETPNLFGGSASRLRHLALLDIRIPWESNLLSHLTTLHIRNPYTCDLSAQQVVQILQSCPDLTSFKLYLQPELHPGPIPVEAFTVELPRLQRLSIRVHPLMTEHLLRRIRIPSCKSFDVDHAEATSPTFSAKMNHLNSSLSYILLAASGVNIDIGSTALRYEAIAKINEDDEEGEGGEEEDGRLVQRIRIQASGDRFTDGFALETLSWLLDNVHTSSFSSPVTLNIRELAFSPQLTIIIDRLSSVITDLNLKLSGVSAKTIVSYLAKPFKVVTDGTITLRWPLPNLTDLSFERCNNIKSEVILGCVQRRAGRGLSGGWRRQREELPVRLTRLRLPRGSSIMELKRIFPDCMEWCGGLQLQLQEEEERRRAQERELVQEEEREERRYNRHFGGYRYGSFQEVSSDSDD